MGKDIKTLKTTKVSKQVKEETGGEGLPLNPDMGDEPTRVGGLFAKYSSLIMPILFALGISYFMISVMAVPKGTYNNAVVGLSQRMGAIETSIGDTITGQETLTASLESLREELAGFTPNTVDQEKLSNLTVELNSLEAEVQGLVIPSQSSLTTIIDTRITEYELRLGELEDDIADLIAGMQEEEDENGDPVVTDESTIWTKEFYCTDPGIEISYSISPSRIEEEEDYIIMVYLLNYDKTVKSNIIVDIIFSPRTGDRVKVDDARIYLDSTRSPFYEWFPKVVKRSDGTCRRVSFSSEKMSIAAATGELETGLSPGKLTLRLEFTLAYE